MNDLDLLQKRKGMTIKKAWFLMIFFVLFAFFSFMFFVLIRKIMGVSTIEGDADYMGFFMVFSLLLSIIYGIKKINFEFPLLKTFKTLQFLQVVVLSICFVYLDSFIGENFKIDLGQQKDHIYKFWWIEIINSVFFVFFQIGVIGHGLLRNYTLKIAFLNTVVLSLALMIPHIILGLALLFSLTFMIYAFTQSFQLAIVPIFFYHLSGILVSLFDQKHYFENNPIKYYFNLNNQQYMIGLGISLILMVIFTFIFLKQNPPKPWQKEPEYEPLNF